MSKTAMAYFNRNGVMFIITENGTKHRFASVSRGVNWCKNNNVEPYMQSKAR